MVTQGYTGLQMEMAGQEMSMPGQERTNVHPRGPLSGWATSRCSPATSRLNRRHVHAGSIGRSQYCPLGR